MNSYPKSLMRPSNHQTQTYKVPSSMSERPIDRKKRREQEAIKTWRKRRGGFSTTVQISSCLRARAQAKTCTTRRLMTMVKKARTAIGTRSSLTPITNTPRAFTCRKAKIDQGSMSVNPTNPTHPRARTRLGTTASTAPPVPVVIWRKTAPTRSSIPTTD